MIGGGRQASGISKPLTGVSYRSVFDGEIVGGADASGARILEQIWF